MPEGHERLQLHEISVGSCSRVLADCHRRPSSVPSCRVASEIGLLGWLPGSRAVLPVAMEQFPGHTLMIFVLV